MKLVLPPAVSSNRYWRSFVPKGWSRAVVALSPEAKAYKAEVGWLAKAAGVRPVSHPVEVRLNIYPKDRRMLDVDNAIKVCLDSLNGIAYVDDKLVWRVSAERMQPDGHARLEVEILAYEPAPLSLELAA